ncbi:hypothetical protein [Aliamphritea spongicola]
MGMVREDETFFQLIPGKSLYLMILPDCLTAGYLHDHSISH